VTDRILVRGVRAYGRHGFSHELNHPQPFDVDADLVVDTGPAVASDDLGKTIDYALAVQEIRRTVEQESFSLVESLADAVAVRLLSFGAGEVRVCVSKPAAALLLGAESIAVEVVRTA